MKKCMLIILTLLCSCIYGDSWQENWVKAVENCECKNYALAEEYFSAAIGIISKENKTENYHVYVDRARMLLLLERYEEGLFDINIALSSTKMTDHDMARGLLTRMVLLSRLNINHKQQMQDLDDLKKYDKNIPEEEITDEYIIIRNIPDCECYQKIMSAYFLHAGICETQSDIQILKSRIMIVKKKKCDKGVNCTCANKKTLSSDMTCHDYCDYMATAGHVFCAGQFKSLRCITGCSWAVDYLRKKCYWCCRNGEFYKNCIEPFAFILDYIKEPCDPYWD